MTIAANRWVLSIGLAVVGGGLAVPLLGAMQAPPPAPSWVVGDVFVAIGDGQYEVRSNAGALKQTITIGITQRKAVAGCWFDSQFNLYTTDFTNTKIIRHELTGQHAQSIFADVDAVAPDGQSESVVMAVNGDVYVGNAGKANGMGTKNIVRYASNGTFLASYFPTVEDRGVDWIDLATDQRTMFYTSEGRTIWRFDVGSNTQLPSFATLAGSAPADRAFAIRLLPPFDGSGGLLVADNSNVKRLDGSGNVVATYDAVNENAWQALNLDPDGIHFWAGGFTSGKLYRFPIYGAPVPPATFVAPDLGPFQTGGAGDLQGLCVMGEAQLQVRPLQLSNTSASTQLIDVTAPFGDPAATGENDFYSYSTWRIRIHVKAGQTVVAAVGFTPQSTTLGCDPTDPNDFDCRFTESPAQCVPFFKDPSKDAPNVGPATTDPYRCAYYRVKDMPICSASSPSTCPFDEPFIPGSNSIHSEIIGNLTNPPQSVFNIQQLYGNGGKGNPRLMRDPDAVAGNQFFVDATTAIIDWPYIGTGTPNDYAPVMRNTSVPGSCARIISPQGSGLNSGSSAKIVLEVTDATDSNGNCIGNGVAGATTGTNIITLAVAGTGNNPTLEVYCDTPGTSLGCFVPVAGQAGRYQSTVYLDPTVIPPDTLNAYIFAVTSVNVASENPSTQGPGMFPPTSRQYFVCPSGSNCGQ